MEGRPSNNWDNVDAMEVDDMEPNHTEENILVAGKLVEFRSFQLGEYEVSIPKDILMKEIALEAEYSSASPHVMNDTAAFAFKNLFTTARRMEATANKQYKRIRELEETSKAMEEAHQTALDSIHSAKLDTLQSELQAEKEHSASKMSAISQLTRDLAQKDAQILEMKEKNEVLLQELETYRRQSVNTQLNLQVQDLKHVAQLTHVMRDPADQVIDIVDFPNGFLIRKAFAEHRKKYRYFLDEVIQALQESDKVREIRADQVPALLESLFQAADSYVSAQLQTLEVSLTQHFGVEDLTRDACAHRFYLRTMQRVRYPRLMEDIKAFQVAYLSPELQRFESVISDMKAEQEVDDSSPCSVVALYQFLVTTLLQCRLSDPACVLHPPPNQITSLDVCERVNQGPKGKVDSEHMISLFPGLYFLDSSGRQPSMPEAKGLMYHHYRVTAEATAIIPDSISSPLDGIHENVIKENNVSVPGPLQDSPDLLDMTGTVERNTQGPFDGMRTLAKGGIDDIIVTPSNKPAPFLRSTSDGPKAVPVNNPYAIVDYSKPIQNTRPSVLRGLPNVGNTCYLNAVLQCIAHVDPLIDIFDTAFPMDAVLATTLSTFLRQYRSGSNHDIQQGVRDVKRLMGEIRPALFAGNDQRDAFTFFRELMNQLHRELNAVKAKPYPNIQRSTSANPNELLVVSDYAWQDLKTREDSPVSERCFLQRRVVERCSACGAVASTFDAQSSLILPIPQNTAMDNRSAPPSEQVLAIQAIAQMPLESQVLLNFEVIATLDTPVGVVMQQVLRTLRQSGFLQDPNSLRQFHVSALQAASLPGGATSPVFLELARSVNATSSATEADRAVRIGDVLGNSNVLVFSQLAHPTLITATHNMHSNHPVYVDVSFGLLQNKKVMPVVGSIPIRLSFSNTSSLLQYLGKKVSVLLGKLLPPVTLKRMIGPPVVTTCSPEFRWTYLDHQGQMRHNPPTNRIVVGVVDGSGHFTEASKWHFTVTKNMRAEPSKVTSLMSVQKRVLSSEEIHTQQNPIFRRRKPFTLVEAINAYSRPRRLEGTKCCESCNRTQTLEISYELWRPPKVLVICLTRFEQTVHAGELTKVDTPCDFPLELDLAGVAPAATRDGHSSIFDLYSVSEHSGDCREGHYMACARDAANQWYRFDDLDVMPIPFEMISQSQAYFLIYVRR